MLVSTTVHAIPNIMRSPNITIKFMWFICFLVSLGFCGFFLYDGLLNYFEYKYVTNIEEINEYSAEFPTVSFCINASDINLSESLLICTFNYEQCTSADFETIHESVQTCFRFNSKEPVKRIRSTLPAYGLNVFLWTKSFYFGQYKAVLYVQNYTRRFKRIRAYQLDQNDFLTAGANSIKIYREFIEKLPLPFNDCININSIKDSSEEIYNYFIRNKISYAQIDCFDLCVDQEIMTLCNCSYKPEGRYCYQKDIFNQCVNKQRFIFTSKSDIPKRCKLLCKPECETVIYRVTVNYEGSSIQFILNNMLLPKTINKEFIESLPKENILFLSISYSNLNYRYVNQIAKTNLVDLVSNVGGT